MSFKDNYPLTPPTLSLDFVNASGVDPRVTFSRSSKATYYNPAGLLTVADVNVPRIDYDPITHECKGLLIEELRTNLLTYSDQFDNAFWNKVTCSVLTNTVNSPDGTATADKIVEGTGSVNPYIAQDISVNASATYTFSCYAKQDSLSQKRYLMLLFPSTNFGANIRILVDLSNGSKTEINSPIATSVTSIGNQWYRISVTATALVTGTAGLQIRLTSQVDGSLAAYTGDGTSGVYIFGAQLEVGTFPTSYIPTTTAQVTRTADNASMTGTNFSSWYNQSEGTVATEYDVILNTGNRIIFDIGAGGVFGTTAYGVQTSSNVSIAPAAAPVNMASTANTTALFNKIAVGLQTNNTIIAANSTLGIADTSCNMPANATTMTLGNSPWAVGAVLNGHIQSIKYYPIRLTNAQLQTLTNP